MKRSKQNIPQIPSLYPHPLSLLSYQASAGKPRLIDLDRPRYAPVPVRRENMLAGAW